MLVHAFGLHFSVPDAISLVGWPAVDERAPDVEVVLAPVSTASGARLRTGSVAGQELLWVDRLEDGNLRIEARGEARFELSADAREVRCECIGPLASALLVGQVFPLVAALSGMEVFHTSAVQVGQVAWLLAAPSGVGKTTLAAHLVAGGAELLADDVVGVTVQDGALLAWGTGGPLRLSESTAAEVVAAGAGRLRVVTADADKVLVASRAVADRPVRLGAFVVLARGGAEVSSVVSSMAQPSELLGATFNRTIRTPERLRQQFELCHQIAAEVPVFRAEAGVTSSPASFAALVRDQVRVA